MNTLVSDYSKRNMVIALSIVLILLAVLVICPIARSTLIPPPIPIEYGEPPPIAIMP